MTSQQPRTERPAEGLARGRWEAPPWAIAVLGAAVIVGASIYLIRLLRRTWRGPQ